METFELPVEILERAADITLQDLLEAEFSQAWAISMICNASNYSIKFDAKTDTALQMELHQLMRGLAKEERAGAFSTCKALLALRHATAKPGREVVRLEKSV